MMKNLRFETEDGRVIRNWENTYCSRADSKWVNAAAVVLGREEGLDYDIVDK